jgi:hypothetical protein
MREIEILKSVLASNFQYEFYANAVKNAKEEISANVYFKENWNDVIRFILYRRLGKGEPLKLINETANLVLYENSDCEAYRWLDLFLINIAKEDGIIINYQIERKS